VGHEQGKVKKAAQRLWGGNIRFVENPRYEHSNTVYSLWLAIRYVNDDFFYINGDVVFRPDLLDRLAEEEGDGVLGVVGKHCGKEEVKVVVEDSRLVDIGKDISRERCFGEFIGVALFRESMLKLFNKSLHNLVEERGLVNEYFEAALAAITGKVVLRVADISDIPCIEIDFPKDLRWARRHSSDFGGE